MFTPHYVSHVTCTVSRVTCQMSRVMNHVSLNFFFFFWREQFRFLSEGLLSTGPTPSSLDIVCSGTLTYLVNGSSHNKTGSSLIRRNTRDRQACNSCSEEQRQYPTLVKWLYLSVCAEPFLIKPFSSPKSIRLRKLLQQKCNN